MESSEMHETAQQREKRILEFWEKGKIFRFDDKTKKKIFSIDTPPPTVSGRMHIGHAFSYSQQDFIARYKRMKGFEVFYPFGTDDNGLPTERLVEKAKGVKAKDMPRNDFINLCMDFLKQERIIFIQDWKNIGISCDFGIIYSTIDTHSRRIAQWSFLDLFKKGRLYRKDAPAMFCPECKTGVAQVEVKDKALDSIFSDIVFQVNNKEIVIATTRPELLPACVAVFFHPDDSRYLSLKGKKAKVPLFNFEVPILPDKRADPAKGTGIVMCCTFGDQTDMEWQKAHNLSIKMAITEDGRMSSLAGKYSGMLIKEARKEILNDLKKANLIRKQTNIKHVVNVHERCGREIEIIKSKQWFVRYLDLKEEMLKWGAELKWHPENMKYRYDNWVKGLQWDWLISNQRYFGVAFPVWYCSDCNEVILASEKSLPVDPLRDKPPVKQCPKCKSHNISPETDVLNTWFTSSLTPQLSTYLMPANLKKKLFPMSLRPQAHDIITFWLFNTIVKSQLHFKKNPWHETMISGFATLEGEKMSKSKGNVIAPQDVMAKYSADALRFWAASSKLGEDFDYQEKEITAGMRFITKMQNSARFIFSKFNSLKKTSSFFGTDRIFLSQLNNLIKKATLSMDNYNYAQSHHLSLNFFWHAFCDNYLELVKKRFYEGTEKEFESAQYTLYISLLALLKIFAPFTPFITEEIYQNFFKKDEKAESVHLLNWPAELTIDSRKLDEEKWNKLIEVIEKVRKSKSESKKSMKSQIELTLGKEDKALLDEVLHDLIAVTNAKEIKTGAFNVRVL